MDGVVDKRNRDIESRYGGIASWWLPGAEPQKNRGGLRTNGA